MFGKEMFKIKQKSATILDIAAPLLYYKIQCYVENVIQIMYDYGTYSFPGN